jgi:uncharacterized protein (DUF427 family)
MTDTRTPGTASPVSFSQPGRHVRALFQGHLIADTAKPVIVHETGRPDVVYFPKADVETAVLRANAVTTCPWKGQATNFTIFRDGVFAENAAWTYDHAIAEAAVLSDMIGFDPKHVTIEVYGDETDAMWRKQQAEMGDYIRHTDSGSGTSQAEKWPANVHADDDADQP